MFCPLSVVGLYLNNTISIAGNVAMRHILQETPNSLLGQLGTVVVQIIIIKWPLMRDLKEKSILPL